MPTANNEILKQVADSDGKSINNKTLETNIEELLIKYNEIYSKKNDRSIYGNQHGKPDEQTINHRNSVVAHAIPTLSFPRSMLPRTKSTSATVGPLKRRPPLPNDSDIIKDMINILPHSSNNVARGGSGCWIGLSSAYLNPTEGLINVFRNFTNKNLGNGKLAFLTAGGVSHGFAPKVGTEGEVTKNWIPQAYLLLCRQLSEMLKSRVFLFEDEGWTFHAKGLWLCTGQSSRTNNGKDSKHDLIGGGNGKTLQAIVVGSGNYGSRSENLDLESNCVVILNDEEGEFEKENVKVVREDWIDDWNRMACKSKGVDETAVDKNDEHMFRDFALSFVKKVL